MQFVFCKYLLPLWKQTNLCAFTQVPVEDSSTVHATPLLPFSPRDAEGSNEHSQVFYDVNLPNNDE